MMTLLKTLNVFGVGLQLIGLLLLSRLDYSEHALSSAKSQIRNTQLIEIYQAAKDDKPYERSTQELEVEQLTLIADGNKKWFKLGLGLIIAGTTMQLIGTILGD
jgi:hypothetical protein